VSDRSFLRAGGVAGILLALTAWLSVVEYYALVPAAQQVALTGTRDPNTYLASLSQGAAGLLIFNGLYALFAFWSLVGIIAVYFRLRANGEAWAFFGTFVGAFAAAATIVSSVGDVARLRFLAESTAIPEGHLKDLMGVTALNYAFREPSAANPFGIVTFMLSALWFLVVAALMWRGGFPRPLALLGAVAFADLTAGFVASVAGATGVATVAALVAGGLGGPVFWLWLGILLWRDPRPRLGG